MPTPQEPFARYVSRRRSRLASLAWLRQSATAASYRADELLVTDSGRDHVGRFFRDNPALPAPQGSDEIMPGLHRYHVPGVDVLAAVRGIHRALPAGTRVAGPNHVFQGSPFNHGGPYGPPAPTTAASLPGPADDGRLARVSIIDTGLWNQTVLPSGYLNKDEIDYETATDVDNDGVLDGDVGHANFVAGVFAAHSPRAELSVLKVLDTFGVCTEDQLVAAIARIDPATQVINLSLGGYTLDDAPPVGLSLALAAALQGKDRVVVAAAGNDGNGTNPFWPAAFAGAGLPWSSQVVAVAAHDGQQLCPWSNTGPWVTLAAAGADIQSTFINHALFPDGWAQWSGTSFATPRAGAAIAGLVDEQTGPVAALASVLATVAAGGARFGGYAALT